MIVNWVVMLMLRCCVVLVLVWEYSGTVCTFSNIAFHNIVMKAKFWLFSFSPSLSLIYFKKIYTLKLLEMLKV